MKAFAKTDIGKARENNQDYYYIPNQTEKLNLCILADGMGGYNGGEVASKLATETVKKYIKTNFPKEECSKEAILSLIKNAMEYANMVVYEKSKEVKELEGMGTTLDICLIYNNKVYIGHIGDSRIYRIRKNIIRRITTDHSYVEKLVKDGTITREEAFYHPKKNMLMKALGCNESIEPDILVKEFLENDIMLMCSDGLTNMLTEEAIYDIVQEQPETACENLVKRANENGGYDNISVILIKN